MVFDENRDPNSPHNANPTISFSQMVQPKSSMMFQSVRTARVNIENPLSPQERDLNGTNDINKPFKRIDSLTPEFKK